MPIVDSIDILKNRLASGEISLDEYSKLIAVVTSSPEKSRSTTQAQDVGSVIAQLDDIFLYENYIVVAGQRRNVADIVYVNGSSRASSINLIPTEKYSSVNIIFRGGDNIFVSESKIIFGGARHNQIRDFLKSVLRVSYDARSEYVLQQLRNAGQVRVGLSVEGEVFISSTGIISTNSRSMDLKQCCKSGTFGIGTQGGSLNGGRTYNVDEVVISDRPKGFLGFDRGSLRFELDSDVARELLELLSKPGITIK